MLKNACKTKGLVNKNGQWDPKSTQKVVRIQEQKTLIKPSVQQKKWFPCGSYKVFSIIFEARGAKFGDFTTFLKSAPKIIENHWNILGKRFENQEKPRKTGRIFRTQENQAKIATQKASKKKLQKVAVFLPKKPQEGSGKIKLKHKKPHNFPQLFKIEGGTTKPCKNASRPKIIGKHPGWL